MRKEEVNLLVSASYDCDGGYKLGAFLLRTRHRKKLGTLSQSQIDALDAIGMVWDATEGSFLAALDDRKEYYAEHGNLQFPLNMIGKSDVKLNYWVADCRRKLRNGKFSSEKVELLQTAHIVAENAAAEKPKAVTKPIRKQKGTAMGNALKWVSIRNKG